MRAITLLLLTTIAIHGFGEDVFRTPIPKPLPETWIPPQDQAKQIKEKGFVWIRNFFSREQVELIRDWAKEIDETSRTLLELSAKSGLTLKQLAQQFPLTPIIVPEAKDPSIACRAEDLMTCFPPFAEFVQGNVAAYISHLMNEPYVLFKDKINFKWPGGGAFTPHQDFPAYEFLGPREHITAMISVDSATLANGCLKVAANWDEVCAQLEQSHPELFTNGRPVLPFVIGGKLHGSIQPEYLTDVVWLDLLTSPRDLVLFDSYLPHYSEPNNSLEPRRAFFITHNRLIEGEHRRAYYFAKREDPDNPIFHIGTPTKARTKE